MLYHQQQNQWYLQMFLLAHFEATLYFSVAKSLAHNNITISYFVQENSLRLKSSVVSKWASKHLWGYHLFCGWWYMRNSSVKSKGAKVKIKNTLPSNVQQDTGIPFHRNFNSILRRDHQKHFQWASRLWVGRRKELILGNFNFILRRGHQKHFLWSSRLWVGRRKEPILGYVPKYDERKNLVYKGLILVQKRAQRYE